ncbi:DUF2523 domain-containing protein [Ectothiorhodospiraceae bacterium WFHF3C12]|nr:DUF2523 domain-containing protein [Ectothiorhodospiraceae bacterium WFHF3C12]
MAAIIVALKGLLVWILAGAVARLLAGAGLAILTYAGLKTLAESFLAEVANAMGQIPSGAYEVMAMAGVGDALSAIGSALLTAAALKSASIALGVKS